MRLSRRCHLENTGSIFMNPAICAVKGAKAHAVITTRDQHPAMAMLQDLLAHGIPVTWETFPVLRRSARIS
jgi:hypothetical protein